MMQRDLFHRLVTLAALSAFTALPAACGSASDSDGTTTRPTVAQTSVFGRVTSTAGGPVAGAMVALDGRSTRTDSAGAFAIAAPGKDVVVRVTAPGYADSAWSISVVQDAANALDPVMLPLSEPAPLDATTGGEVSGPRGARLVVPANALVDASGNAVTGMVGVRLTPLDPTIAAQLEAAPGALEARTSDGADAALESFGMIDVTIENAAGSLQVAPGQRLTVEFPAAGAAPPETVRLWSFDEDTALWAEEGTAKLEGGLYVAELPHLSFWNADEPITATCVMGRTVDAETGEPLPGARVGARGVDYAGISDAHAGADGRWAIAVRRSSTVVIIASHAAGGGIEREVKSGSAPTSLPPSVDTPGCHDTGDWPVTRGVVTLTDGTTVSCNTASLTDLESCIPTMVASARCFSPSGTCTSSGAFGLSATWSNGARVVTTIEGASALTSWFGPDGAPCGTQRVDGNTVLVTGPGGQTETVTVSVAGDGAVTYGCVDGSTRTLTTADQERLSACTSPDTASCTTDGSTLGTECERPIDCGDGLACCGGYCIPDGVCPFEACKVDSDCGDGLDCCGGLIGCAPDGQCEALSAECQVDADCGNSSSCCDGDCLQRPFCEGECRTGDDCGEGLPFCCPAAGVDRPAYCASSEGACFDGRACDAGCGPSGELECCEQDGSDPICLGAESCWSGRACTVDADCGTLTCCDRTAIGVEARVCETAAVCILFTPCTTLADCGGVAGIVCCEREDVSKEPVCLDEVLCNLE